jgi:hypothetical protein
MTFISLYNKEKLPEDQKVVEKAKVEIEKEKEDVRI